jgi:uncharacterized protein
MRAILIADDDSLVGKIPNESADVLISLGDIYDSTIERAQKGYRFPKVFAIKGNHDAETNFPAGVIDLHLTVSEHQGIRFGGFCGCWKYKPRGRYLFEQSEVTSALRSFPAVDVFIAHNSPQGLHERDTSVHQGFTAFMDYIDRVQPGYFLHGHQHMNKVSQRNGTTIIGVYGEVALDLDIGNSTSM